MIAEESPRETEPSADVLSWRPPRAVCFVVNGGRAGGGVLVAPDLVLAAYRTVADLIDDQTTATTHCFFGSIVGAKGYERTRDREVATIVAFERQIRISRNAPTPTTDGCALLRLRENEAAASDAVSPAPISPHSPRPQVGEVVFVASRYDKWSPMRVAEIVEGGFALERVPNDPIALDGDGGVCFTRDGAVIGLVAEYYTPLPKENVYVVAADALYEALVGAAPAVEALLERAAPDATQEQSAPEPEPAAPQESLFIRVRRVLQPALRRASVITGVALALGLPYLTALLIRAGANAQSDYDSLLAHADGSPPDTVTALIWEKSGEHLFIGTREGRAYRFNLSAATFQEIPEPAASVSRHQPVREIIAIYGSSDIVRRGGELSAGIGPIKATVEKVSFFPGDRPAQRGAEKHVLRLRNEENASSADVSLPPEMGKPVDLISTQTSFFVVASDGWIGEFDKASLDRNGKSKASYEPTRTLRLSSPIVSIARSPDRVAFASSRGEITLEPETKAHPTDFPIDRYGPIAQVALASPLGDFLLLALTREGQLFINDSHNYDWTLISIPRLIDSAVAGQRTKVSRVARKLTAAALDLDGHYVLAADELGLVYVIALDEEVGNPDKSPRLVAVIRGHAGPVTQLAISPNRQWLASASLDGRLRVTHLPTAIREANWPLHDLLAPSPPPPLMPRPLDAPASVARNPAEHIDDARDRIIVFGADKDLAAARVEIERARAAGFVDVEILLRQNWYRSVAHFPSDEARNAALPKLRALSPNAADAYARRVSDWCDSIEPTGAPDMIRCRLISDGNGGLSGDLLKNNAFRNVQEPLNAKSGADLPGAGLQPVQSPPPAQQFPNQMRKRLK